RLHARDRDVRGCRSSERQHACFGKEDVAVEAGALMAGLDDVDDAKHLHLAAIVKFASHEDDIIELDNLAFIHRNPEIERLRILRAENLSNFHAHTSTLSKRRLSIPRRITMASPSRRRSSCSNAPTGARFCGDRGSRTGSLANAGRHEADMLALFTASSIPTPVRTSTRMMPATP